MKLKAALLSLFVSVSAHAGSAPSFSAFGNGDTLYVTILGDSCNNIRGSLNVEPLCKADRLTRNYSPSCEVELMVLTTKKFCNDSKPYVRVLEISLAGNNVAPEAKFFKINYLGQQIQVQIDR